MVMISGNCCKDAHISFAAMDLKKCIRHRELGKKKGRLELTYYKDKDTLRWLGAGNSNPHFLVVHAAWLMTSVIIME